METQLFREINQEVESIKATFDFNHNILEDIIKEIKSRNITNVIVAARGSSDHVGIYLKYLFEIYAHIPAGFAATSVVTKYDSYLDLKTTLVIAISQSGSGVDIKEFVERSRDNGATTLSITNNLDSIISSVCEFNLYLNLEKELALATSKTFISQMYLTLMFTAYYTSSKELLEDVKNVSLYIKKTLDKVEYIKKYVPFFDGFDDCYFLSRGIDMVSNFEASLKLQETTYIKAKAYSIADFYHGPFAIADEKQNFIVFLTKGKCYDDAIAMIKKLQQVKVNLLVITNDNNYKLSSNAIFLDEFSEVVAPLLNIICMHLLVNFIFLRKGMNPDKPRGLNKVTITR